MLEVSSYDQNHARNLQTKRPGPSNSQRIITPTSDQRTIRRPPRRTRRRTLVEKAFIDQDIPLEGETHCNLELQPTRVWQSPMSMQYLSSLCTHLISYVSKGCWLRDKKFSFSIFIFKERNFFWVKSATDNTAHTGSIPRLVAQEVICEEFSDCLVISPRDSDSTC